jgi:hypothetical protein
MAYTSIDDSTLYFETLTWTGNGNTPRSLTGLDFQPNMVWSKRRDDAAGHNLLDSVRGAGVDAELCPSSSGVEGSNNQNAYGYMSLGAGKHLAQQPQIQMEQILLQQLMPILHQVFQ